MIQVFTESFSNSKKKGNFIRILIIYSFIIDAKVNKK